MHLVCPLHDSRLLLMSRKLINVDKVETWFIFCATNISKAKMPASQQIHLCHCIGYFTFKNPDTEKCPHIFRLRKVTILLFAMFLCPLNFNHMKVCHIPWGYENSVRGFCKTKKLNYPLTKAEKNTSIIPNRKKVPS